MLLKDGSIVTGLTSVWTDKLNWKSEALDSLDEGDAGKTPLKALQSLTEDCANVLVEKSSHPTGGETLGGGEGLNIIASGKSALVGAMVW